MPLNFSNSPHWLDNLSFARAERVLSATVFAAFPIQALFDQMLVAESFPRVMTSVLGHMNLHSDKPVLRGVQYPPPSSLGFHVQYSVVEPYTVHTGCDFSLYL